MYLKLPVDDEGPGEARIADQHDQVSQVSTTADSDVCDDWVSELLQSVGDAYAFALEHCVLNGGLDEVDSGSLPSCGRNVICFLFRLTLTLCWMRSLGHHERLNWLLLGLL